MATVVSKASSGLSQTTPAPGTLLSAPSLWSSAHRVCAPPLGASHRCGDPPEPGTDSAPGWVAGGCHGCWWRRTSGGTSGSLPWGTAVQQKAGSSSPGRPLPCAPGAVTAPQPKRGAAGARGECRGCGAGRRGFHRPPAIHAGERKWTGGFCGPVTAWTLGQTLSTSFLSHLHPHLLPAGRRQAPACRKPSETGGPGGGPGKAPPGGKTRLHLGKREGQVLSQLALVRTSM